MRLINGFIVLILLFYVENVLKIEIMPNGPKAVQF